MGCLQSKELGINDNSLLKVDSPSSVHSKHQQNNNKNGRLGIAPRQLPNYNSSNSSDSNDDQEEDKNPTPPSMADYYPSRYRLIGQCAIGIQNIQASSMFISDDSVSTDDSSPDIDLTPATNISDDSSITSCSPDNEEVDAATPFVNDNTEESGVVNWLEESNTTLFTSTSATCEKKSYGSPYHPLSTATESSILPSSDVPLPKNNFGVVNDYIILSELGAGSHSTVRLAKHKSTNELFAVKIMNRKLIEQNALDIQQEISIMKSLQHPNILRLYDVIDDPNKNKVYLITEFCQQGDLMNIIKASDRKELQSIIKTDISSDDVLRRISCEIMNGLFFLHQNNIVHNDLKPSNILISRDGTAKLADFGVSQTRRVRLDFAGTPLFQAPEVSLSFSHFYIYHSHLTIVER